VDLKTAFDSVDRKILAETLRKRGVKEGLVERVEEVLGETKRRVRLGDDMGEGFWTEKGLRQGCLLIPILFNLLIADIKEIMGKVKWGRVKIGQRRVYSLAYADDIVLLADKEEEMKSMVERLEGYLDEKGLELNVKKTKIIIFRNSGGRWARRTWR